MSEKERKNNQNEKAVHQDLQIYEYIDVGWSGELQGN